MGKRERREFISRLAVLLAHLLKWQIQEDRRGSSWQATIRVLRRALRDHLKDNPSLKSQVAEALEHAYATAVIAAAGETGMIEADFPSSCPWTFAEVMDDAFWPGP